MHVYSAKLLIKYTLLRYHCRPSSVSPSLSRGPWHDNWYYSSPSLHGSPVPALLLSRSSHYQFVDYDDRVNHDKRLFVISQSRRSSTRVRDNKPTYYSHHRPYTGDQVYRLRFHACVVIAGAEPRFCLCATPANCDLQSVTLSFWGARRKTYFLRGNDPR